MNIQKHIGNIDKKLDEEFILNKRYFSVLYLYLSFSIKAFIISKKNQWWKIKNSIRTLWFRYIFMTKINTIKNKIWKLLIIN